MTPTDDPKGVAAEMAAELLARLPGGLAEPVRATAAAGRLACLVLVWDAAGPMPTAGGDQRRRAARGRAGCRADVLAVLAAAGRPLTRKQVVRAVRAAGCDHGPGTVAKALADLTAAGELINPRDKRGYRLPSWVKPRLSLFG
ncbi:MAG: hypothetical protein U0871_01875 [Gemmataceae bacterium]